MSRRSFAVGSIIVIAWLITMGFLLKNHYLHPETVPAFDNADLFASVEAVERWRDVEEYMLILQNDVVVGATATTISKSLSPDRNMTFHMQFAMTAKLSPILPAMDVKVVAGLDPDFNLTKFHGTGGFGPASFSATGMINKDLLHLKTLKGNVINLKKLKLVGPVSLSEAVRPALGKQLKIATGNQIRTPIIDPLTGSNRGIMEIRVQDAEIVKVGDTPVKAFKVVSTLHDIATTMWVDSDGNTIKRQLVGNFVMERTSGTQALKRYPQLGQEISIPELDPAEFTTVPVTQPRSSTQDSGSLGILESLLR